MKVCHRGNNFIRLHRAWHRVWVQVVRHRRTAAHHRHVSSARQQCPRLFHLYLRHLSILSRMLRQVWQQIYWLIQLIPIVMGMREHLDEREVIRRKMLIERSEEKFFFTVFFSVKHSKKTNSFQAWILCIHWYTYVQLETWSFGHFSNLNSFLFFV